MSQAVELFKALADPIRLRLAALLAVEGEVCVCNLAKALREQHFKISRHLGIMRSAGLVLARREGIWTYYRLARPSGGVMKRLRAVLGEYAASDRTALADRRRFVAAGCGVKGGCDK